jgi:hypothetical protein
MAIESSQWEKENEYIARSHDDAFQWGKTSAVKAFNKFKEGSIIGSEFIMKQGIKTLIDLIEEALEKENIFSSLAGMGEFWKFVSSSEISKDQLSSMPKEFQTVLSKERITTGQKVNIPDEFKPMLKELKQIVHVGELLYKRKGDEDASDFIARSKLVLEKCRAELKLG